MIKFLLFAGLLAFLFYYVRRFVVVPASPMKREEAARLLGVPVDADGPAVIEAHRRLIAKVHPDTGGSEALAAQVNRARDVMLRP